MNVFIYNKNKYGRLTEKQAQFIQFIPTILFQFFEAILKMSAGNLFQHNFKNILSVPEVIWMNNEQFIYSIFRIKLEISGNSSLTINFSTNYIVNLMSSFNTFLVCFFYYGFSYFVVLIHLKYSSWLNETLELLN